MLEAGNIVIVIGKIAARRLNNLGYSANSRFSIRSVDPRYGTHCKLVGIQGIFQLRDFMLAERSTTSVNQFKTKASIMKPRVIFNKRTTIYINSSGEKTIVKCASDDEFDHQKGFMAAYIQNTMGINKTEYGKLLEDIRKTYEASRST